MNLQPSPGDIKTESYKLLVFIYFCYLLDKAESQPKPTPKGDWRQVVTFGITAVNIQGFEMAAEKLEVCPKEDLVEELMEYLVCPSVHIKDNDQQVVAIQMYAVVLLYNYYHRKLHPKIELLDFVAFCELSVFLRPSMKAFMKSTIQAESTEMNNTEDELSITEKEIKSACNISMALDASKDVPNIEGWPVSKVSVLLVDAKKENCLLKFGNVTKGVWSLIEIDLDESKINSKISAKEKIGKKRKRKTRRSADPKNAVEDGFQRLAFDTVKEETGINRSDLVILETHIVYSLNKENTATQVYIMQWIQWKQSICEYKEFLVEYVLKSLQGPLVEKITGFWTIRPVVEYYRMLPYVGIMSSWFLRWIWLVVIMMLVIMLNLVFQWLLPLQCFHGVLLSTGIGLWMQGNIAMPLKLSNGELIISLKQMVDAPVTATHADLLRKAAELSLENENLKKRAEI
ncbi:unnamed protein product [Fraxinus pennsylvanica]|uniref:Uncharacterized protein n=1 Tax=Fraxinus pennsylvanica TaxID=56036 RepID=A0AAD1ZE55_9LAMI|nr:unnamed protein product [Fraxinus pennsylvanica]